MSTFRVDLVAHLSTAVNAYITANPTILRRYWNRRPGTFGGEVPMAYMDNISEQIIILDNGTYQREISTAIVVVDTFADNEQTGARFDIAVDGLVSHLVRNIYASVGGGILALTGYDDTDIEQPATIERPAVLYRATRMTLNGQIQEGRPS